VNNNGVVNGSFIIESLLLRFDDAPTHKSEKLLEINHEHCG